MYLLYYFLKIFPERRFSKQIYASYKNMKEVTAIFVAVQIAYANWQSHIKMKSVPNFDMD